MSIIVKSNPKIIEKIKTRWNWIYTVPLSEFSDEVINAMYKLGIVDIINETFQEKKER